VAAGWAVLSPLVAALLTRAAGVAAVPPSPADVHRRTILRFALLESGVIVSAVAVFAGPLRWPLYAALVPLAAMVATFPRPQAG
jgi:hypothetical protein